jgi:hypothetical protein
MKHVQLGDIGDSLVVIKAQHWIAPASQIDVAQLVSSQVKKQLIYSLFLLFSPFTHLRLPTLFLTLAR